MTAVAATAGGTIADALADAVPRLAAAGVPEPRADAEVLLAHALATTRTGVIAHARDGMPAAGAGRLAALLARRAGRREPVAYLVGEREFWSLSFAVDRRVLVPRPETELVVEVALRLAPGARRVADVGTGSGCLAVALARELPRAAVVAIDASAGALAVAAVNVARLAPRVRLVRGDLLEAVGPASVDLIVSNPPYVPTGDIDGLAPEVRDHEPRAALDGGPDGLAALSCLLADAPSRLLPGGWVVVEMGMGQADAVQALAARDPRVDRVLVAEDAAGIPRVCAARRVGGGGG